MAHIQEYLEKVFGIFTHDYVIYDLYEARPHLKDEEIITYISDNFSHIYDTRY